MPWWKEDELEIRSRLNQIAVLPAPWIIMSSLLASLFYLAEKILHGLNKLMYVQVHHSD